MAFSCSICGTKPRYPIKLGAIYWRWPVSPEDWERFRQRLCPQCVAQAIAPILAFHSDECCHGAEEHDDGELVWTWYTLYTPKVKDGPTAQGQLATCLLHLPQVRGAMTRGADDISRGSGNGAPRALNPEADPWAAVELP